MCIACRSEEKEGVEEVRSQAAQPRGTEFHVHELRGARTSSSHQLSWTLCLLYIYGPCTLSLVVHSACTMPDVPQAADAAIIELQGRVTHLSSRHQADDVEVASSSCLWLLVSIEL
jgi:hypothetical protein